MDISIYIYGYIYTQRSWITRQLQVEILWCFVPVFLDNGCSWPTTILFLILNCQAIYLYIHIYYYIYDILYIILYYIHILLYSYTHIFMYLHFSKLDIVYATIYGVFSAPKERFRTVPSHLFDMFENGSERFLVAEKVRTVQNGSWTILFRPSRLARTVQNGSCDGWFGALLQETFVVVRYHLSFYWWKQKVGLNFLDQQNPFEFCVEVASSHKLITAHHIVGFWWFLRRRKQRTRNDTQKYSNML